MAERNVCLNVAPSLTVHTEAGTLSTSGALSDFTDGNIGTYYRRKRSPPPTIATRVEATLTTQWDIPVTIKRFETTWTTYQDGSGGGAQLTSIQILQGTTWTAIQGAIGRNTTTLVTTTTTGPWHNVKGVRVRLISYNGTLTDNAYAYWAEIKGIMDEGPVRFYDGSASKELLIDPDSPVKIRVDGSNTKGIHFCATSESYASAIRLYDGSTVKALGEYDP